MKNILIYTGPSCNFCDAAKRLLERNKLKFSEIDVSSGEGIRDEMIKKRSGYSENDVIKIMRKKLKPSSFKLWRKRAKNQSIKHRKKFELSRKEIRRKIKKNDYI